MKHKYPWGRGEGERGEQRGTQNPDTRNVEPQWMRNEREQRAAGWNEDRPPGGGREPYESAYGEQRAREPYAGARDPRETRSSPGTWEEHSRGYEARGWDDLDFGAGQRYQPFHVGTGMGLGTGQGTYGSGGGWDLGSHQRDIGGPSFRGMGPRDYTRTDERILDDIHERLTQSHHIDARDILVDVNQGNVTLTGTVIERRMRYLAEDLVEGVMGVANINNQLKVQNGNTTNTPSPRDDPHH